MEFLVEAKLGALKHSAAILASFQFQFSSRDTARNTAVAVYFFMLFNSIFCFERLGAGCAGKHITTVTCYPVSLQILFGGDLLLAQITGQPTLAVGFQPMS